MADVLAAIVAGNEVVCRIGMAASGEFHRRGFHPTAICGIFGGVAAVARLSGARRGDDDAGARHRRIVRGRTLRLPRRRYADQADAPGLGCARRASRRRGSRATARSARSSVLEGKFGLYHAFLGAERR